eukprot:gene3534-4392_t
MAQTAVGSQRALAWRVLSGLFATRDWVTSLEAYGDSENTEVIDRHGWKRSVSEVLRDGDRVGDEDGRSGGGSRVGVSFLDIVMFCFENGCLSLEKSDLSLSGLSEEELRAHQTGIHGCDVDHGRDFERIRSIKRVLVFVLLNRFCVPDFPTCIPALLYRSPDMDTATSTALPPITGHKLAHIKCLYIYLGSKFEEDIAEFLWCGSWGVYGTPPYLSPHTRRAEQSYEQSYQYWRAKYNEVGVGEEEGGGEVVGSDGSGPRNTSKANDSFVLRCRYDRVRCLVSQDNCRLLKRLTARVIEGIRILLQCHSDGCGTEDAGGGVEKRTATKVEQEQRVVVEYATWCLKLLCRVARIGPSADITRDCIKPLFSKSSPVYDLLSLFSDNMGGCEPQHITRDSWLRYRVENMNYRLLKVLCEVARRDRDVVTWLFENESFHGVMLEQLVKLLCLPPEYPDRIDDISDSDPNLASDPHGSDVEESVGVAGEPWESGEGTQSGVTGCGMEIPRNDGPNRSQGVDTKYPIAQYFLRLLRVCLGYGYGVQLVLDVWSSLQLAAQRNSARSRGGGGAGSQCRRAMLGYLDNILYIPKARLLPDSSPSLSISLVVLEWLYVLEQCALFCADFFAQLSDDLQSQSPHTHTAVTDTERNPLSFLQLHGVKLHVVSNATRALLDITSNMLPSLSERARDLGGGTPEEGYVRHPGGVTGTSLDQLVTIAVVNVVVAVLGYRVNNADRKGEMQRFLLVRGLGLGPTIESFTRTFQQLDAALSRPPSVNTQTENESQDMKEVRTSTTVLDHIMSSFRETALPLLVPVYHSMCNALGVLKKSVGSEIWRGDARWIAAELELSAECLLCSLLSHGVIGFEERVGDNGAPGEDPRTHVMPLVMECSGLYEWQIGRLRSALVLMKTHTALLRLRKEN